jgi:hypothetical protein
MRPTLVTDYYGEGCRSTTKVTIGLLASVLVVSIVSPAFGGPSLAVLDKR